MKKIVSFFVSFMMIFSMLTVVSQAADEIQVRVDGQILDFDVPPQLIDGRTMVPLRVIFQTLGATVSWNEETSTIMAYSEGYSVTAKIGSNVMEVNGELKIMDVPPMIVDSRTLVPVRFVAETFDCNVSWDADKKTVNITSSEIDYSQIEKDTHRTPQYYAGTNIPTYTSVTGCELTDVYIPDGYDYNGKIYRYRYNQDSYLEYIEYLLEQGWKMDDVENDSDSLTYTVFLIKDGQEFGVSAVFIFDEVWITCVLD